MSEFPVFENIVTIPLNRIVIREDRYRKDMGDLSSLAESIKEKGQIQPIIVSSDFVLIAGERRCRAHQLLEKETINAIVRTHTDIESKITEILENLDRKEFTWKEQVKAIEDLHMLFQVENPNCSKRETARKTGLSSGGVITDLNLAEALSVDAEMFEHCKDKQSALKVLKNFQIDEAIAELKLRETKTDYGLKAQEYIFNGDCQQLITQLPDGLINTIISDPFYGIDINKVKKHDGTAGELDIYEDDEELYDSTMLNVIKEIPRVLNANGAVVIFCDIKTKFHWLYKELTAVGIKCDPIPGIWNRNTGQTNQPNTLMARSYETFIYGFKGDGMLVKPGLSNVLTFAGIAPVNKLHPVQKPLALMEELVSRFCLPGAKVLDFMCGSATTCIAAIKCGCSPIGFELGKAKYHVACSRMADVLNAKDAGKLALVSDSN